MSEQIKKEIFSALKASTSLSAIVSTRIFSGWPSSTAIYPCVAFWQTPGGSAEIADDVFAEFDDTYGIDCFADTMTETEKMVTPIDNVITSLPYIVKRTMNHDLYEPDTKKWHKVLRYQILS